MSATFTDWRATLVSSHDDLFSETIRDAVYTPGFPEVGDGWRELLVTALERIACAVAGLSSGSLKITQVKSKYATLRLCWRAGAGLPDAVCSRVNAIIELAEARSACTCEFCGIEGRLFDRGGWLSTACDAHSKGKPVAVRPGWENLHVTRKIVGGKVQIVACVRYVRSTDCFVDVPPLSLGIKE